MITYHEMEDDVLYSREMDDLLVQISRAAGEKITLRRYCPQYDSPANVPREKRSALHTALYRETMALMLMADSARYGVTWDRRSACTGRRLPYWNPRIVLTAGGRSHSAVSRNCWEKRPKRRRGSAPGRSRHEKEKIPASVAAGRGQSRTDLLRFGGTDGYTGPG